MSDSFEHSAMAKVARVEHLDRVQPTNLTSSPFFRTPFFTFPFTEWFTHSISSFGFLHVLERNNRYVQEKKKITIIRLKDSAVNSAPGDYLSWDKWRSRIFKWPQKRAPWAHLVGKAWTLLLNSSDGEACAFFKLVHWHLIYSLHKYENDLSSLSPSFSLFLILSLSLYHLVCVYVRSPSFLFFFVKLFTHVSLLLCSAVENAF